MIARIFIFIILATLLPDLYIYRRYIRHRFDLSLLMRLLWWVPGAAMVSVTLVYAMIDDFAPANLTLFNIYLFMLGLIVVPKLLFVLSSIAGRGVRRMTGGTRNWGNYFGLLLVLGQLYVLFMGSMTGTDRLRVRRVTISVPNLPKSFDGYRIVQFSDIHLGSMRSELLERAVEQMNRLRPDMIAFTGDIQNTRPSELKPYVRMLSSLRAKDGVYSVLGNHDYSYYVDADSRQRGLAALAQRPPHHTAWQRHHSDCGRGERRASAVPKQSRPQAHTAWSQPPLVRSHASARPLGMAPFDTAPHKSIGSRGRRALSGGRPRSVCIHRIRRFRAIQIQYGSRSGGDNVKKPHPLTPPP